MALVQHINTSVCCGSCSAINICRGDTGRVNGSLLNSICSHFPLGSAIIQRDEKINDVFFSGSPQSCQSSIGCLTPRACLPVLQPRPDDGLVELGNLPLQHGPQALSQPVVVLLQLLLVLLLVRCNQVLVLLNSLATPTGRRAEQSGGRDRFYNAIIIFLNDIA